MKKRHLAFYDDAVKKWRTIYVNKNGGITTGKKSFKTVKQVDDFLKKQNKPITNIDYKKTRIENNFLIELEKNEVKKDRLLKNRKSETRFIKERIKEQKKIDKIIKKKPSQLTAHDYDILKANDVYKRNQIEKKFFSHKQERFTELPKYKILDKKTKQTINYNVKFFAGNESQPVFSISKQYLEQVKYHFSKLKGYNRYVAEFILNEKPVQIFFDSRVIKPSGAVDWNEFIKQMTRGVGEMGNVPYSDYTTSKFIIRALL